MASRLERNLRENSIEAFILALEIINKLSISYRLESFIFLFCNAWELLPKAKLLEEKRKIFYPKKRNQPRRSIPLDDCLNRVFTSSSDPTSAFGSPGRINHDSTPFYTSRLYEGLPKEELVKYAENSIPTQYLNKIFCKTSEKMEELPDNSVHLMVASPPYNVGKEYDENLTLSEYRAFLKKV